MARIGLPWSDPPAQPRLHEGEVHVWRIFLDEHVVHLERFRNTLAEDEVIQAERFRFEKHRNRFIVRRGVLRHTLARYLGTIPQQISYRYGAHGKPALAGPNRSEDIRFNMSDSQNVALVALARGCELGVDVEQIREGPADEKIAQRFFSPAENAVLRSLQPPQRKRAFFDCWTRKEAYLKARGDGLSMPLAGFEVSLTPDQPPALLHSDVGPRETARWSMQDLSPASGYVACLVVEGSPTRFRCWNWQA